MNNKLVIAGIIAPSVLFATLAIGAINTKGKETLYPLKGQGDTYSLSFSSSENVLFTSGSDTEKTIYNHVNYPITFGFTGISHSDTVWQTLTSSSSEIHNITKISGLSSINVSFTGKLSLQYGWIEGGDYVYTSKLALTNGVSFDFDSYYPSVFKLTTSSSASISEMSLTYSCVDNDSSHSLINRFTLVVPSGQSTYRINGFNGEVDNLVIPDVFGGKEITTINNGVFSSKTIKSMKLGSNITTLNNTAFSNCANLETIDLMGSKLTTIGTYAFKDCSSLKDFVMPSTVTSLANDAFNGCSSLNNIFFAGTSTSLSHGKIRLYSETEPESNPSNYWRYVNDTPTLWSE